MTDRRVDTESRNRLAEIALGYEENNQRTSRILRLMVLVIGVAAVVFTIQQIKLGEQSDANQRLGREIQAERARSVRDACVGQNERHDNTIRVLDQQLAQIYLTEKGKDHDPAKVKALMARSKAAKTQPEARAVVLEAEKLLGPDVAAQMEQGRAPNVFLIDSLTPVRNCDQAVKASVKRRG